jgi:MFS family permease
MLVITSLAIFGTSIDASLLPTVLPGIKKSLHLDTQGAGFLASIYYFGCIIGGIAFGVVSDAVGTGYRRTWTWIAAMLVSIIGGLLSFAFAASLIGFQLMRVVMGISRGGSEPTNVAMVGEWWQKEDRGFAVGVHHTGFPIGQFIGPLVIGLILGIASWPHVYLLIPLVAIPIVVAQIFVGTRKNQQRVYAWIDDHRLTRPTPDIGGAEKLQNPWPMIKIVLGNPNARSSVIMNFLFLFAELGVATFITTDLTQKGMSLSQAAIISGASGLTGWIGQVGWGTLSDRLGRKFALRIIICGWIVAVLLMIFISSAWSAWVILIFWGLFRNSSYPVNYSLLIDSVPQAAGSAMGIMIGISFGLAGLVVSSVAGFVIQHFGFTADYVMLACVVALALVPLALVKETVPAAAQGPAAG